MIGFIVKTVGIVGLVVSIIEDIKTVNKIEEMGKEVEEELKKVKIKTPFEKKWKKMKNERKKREEEIVVDAEILD